MLNLRYNFSSAPDGFSKTRLSTAIAVARVLCIFGVVYVHAWTGLDGGRLTLADSSTQGVFRWVLMELLGRSAVPLLGMISGWLVAGSASHRTYGAFIGGKTRTILLPMLLWNLLALLIISGGAYAGFLKAPMPASFQEAFNQLLCLTAPNETNVQMAFLRDLFVCMMLAPLLVRLPGRRLILLAAMTAVWTIFGLLVPLLLRPAILLFFIGGILVRRSGMEMRVASLPFAVTAFPFMLLASVKIWLSALDSGLAASHPHVMAGVDLALRFAAALFFWRLAWRIAASRLAGPFLRVEPYAFLMFCAHLIMIWLAGPLIGELTGPLGSTFYPPFLLLQPLMTLGATLLLGRALMACAPATATLLSGGRLRQDRGDAARQRDKGPILQV